MSIERIIHVTDPAVDRQPDSEFTGLPTDQSIHEDLFEQGIRAAGNEKRLLAEQSDESVEL